MLTRSSLVAATALALAALCSTLSAQTKPRLVGITRGAVPPALLLQTDPATPCQVLQRCAPSVGSAVGPAFVGGTAYDATRAGIWATNGTLIGCYSADPTAALPCTVLCPAAPVPGLGATEFATGLALNESTGTLYVTVSDGLVNRLIVLKNTCPLTFVSTCPLTTPPIPPGQVVGGVGSADAAGLMVYASSSFTGVPANTIHIAKHPTPCGIGCSVPIPNCGPVAMGPITGVAIDECAYTAAVAGVFRIWVTDGKQYHALRYTHACGLVSEYCCANTVGDPIIGLCLVPSRATSISQSIASVSCAMPPCPACGATMVHRTVGDPAIGNGSFALALDAAPAVSTAFCLLSFGPCASPGLPFACGAVLLPFVGPFPITLSSGPTLGGAGCTGSYAAPLGIPLNVSICGLILSTEYLVVCPGFGISISNCLSWMISAT